MVGKTWPAGVGAGIEEFGSGRGGPGDDNINGGLALGHARGRGAGRGGRWRGGKLDGSHAPGVSDIAVFLEGPECHVVVGINNDLRIVSPTMRIGGFVYIIG